jgi:nucleotide-binding universal stress UspA family protein
MTGHRIRSILATTDLRDPYDAGLVSAITLGQAADAAIHVIHCVKRPGPFGWWEEGKEGARLDEARSALRSQVDRVCGVGWQPASAHVALGRPATEITNRAGVVAADVIVLGPGGRRFPERTLLGGTADRVIRTAGVPCLLAHRPLPEQPRTVLLATDFSPAARRARDVVVDWLTGPWAAAGGGLQPIRLVMLCVSAYADRLEPPRSLAAMLAADAGEIEDRLADAGVVVEQLVHSSPLVAQGVQTVAGDRNADLVVLGTHGYHPAARMLVGSVATRVAGSVDRPILMVPPMDDGEG